MLKHYINLLTVTIIAIILMLGAGIFLYLHENAVLEEKNPIYFAAGIVLASWGANILFNMFIKNVLPAELYNEIDHIKK